MDCERLKPGDFHFLYDEQWQPISPRKGENRALDRVGVDIQFATTCYKLYLDTGRHEFLEAGDECLHFAFEQQIRGREEPHLRGAIPEWTAWSVEAPDTDLSTFSIHWYLDAADCRLDIFEGCSEFRPEHLLA